MNDLVKMVSQKTGLPEAQAKMAVDVVVGYIKGKLPAPIAAQVDGLIGGGGAPAAGGGDMLGAATGALGDMFGGSGGKK